MTAEGERVKEAIAAAKEYIDTMKGINPKFCNKLSVLKEAASERDRMKRALDAILEYVTNKTKRSLYPWSSFGMLTDDDIDNEHSIRFATEALAEISKIMGEKI